MFCFVRLRRPGTYCAAQDVPEITVIFRLSLLSAEIKKYVPPDMTFKIMKRIV